jgi:hypothetical protein
MLQPMMQFQGLAGGGSRVARRPIGQKRPFSRFSHFSRLTFVRNRARPAPAPCTPPPSPGASNAPPPTKIQAMVRAWHAVPSAKIGLIQDFRTFQDGNPSGTVPDRRRPPAHLPPVQARPTRRPRPRSLRWVVHTRHRRQVTVTARSETGHQPVRRRPKERQVTGPTDLTLTYVL